MSGATTGKPAAARHGVEAGDGRCARTVVGLGRACAEVDDLRAGRRRYVDVAVRDRAVRDLLDCQCEHGGSALRVDCEPERRAVQSVPRQLDRSEQATVVLGRDGGAVGRLSTDVGRGRRRDRPVQAEVGQERVDLGQRGRRAVVARLLACGRGQRGAVDRVRRRVVDRDRRVVPDDLDVARVRLQLDPAAAVVRHPETARRSGLERGRDLPEQSARREEVVRELDAGGQPVRRLRRERILDRLVEWLRPRASGRRRRAATAIAVPPIARARTRATIPSRLRVDALRR